MVGINRAERAGLRAWLPETVQPIGHSGWPKWPNRREGGRTSILTRGNGVGVRRSVVSVCANGPSHSCFVALPRSAQATCHVASDLVLGAAIFGTRSSRFWYWGNLVLAAAIFGTGSSHFWFWGRFGTGSSRFWYWLKFGTGSSRFWYWGNISSKQKRVGQRAAASPGVTHPCVRHRNAPRLRRPYGTQKRTEVHTQYSRNPTLSQSEVPQKGTMFPYSGNTVPC